MFSTTEANQLLKIPLVFQHYTEHKAMDNKMDFLRFIDMHYIHGCPNTPDYDKDMQLPFKTASRSIFTVSSAIVPTTANFTKFESYINIEKNKSHRQNQMLGLNFPSNIWQPPKSC